MGNVLNVLIQFLAKSYGNKKIISTLTVSQLRGSVLYIVKPFHSMGYYQLIKNVISFERAANHYYTVSCNSVAAARAKFTSTNKCSVLLILLTHCFLLIGK